MRAACGVLLMVMIGTALPELQAQAPPPAGAVPDLAGIWDGGTRVRPANSVTIPWGKANFPELNERALAYMKVFDEATSPKYDCQPSTPPAIEYDPYMMEIVQWPDRVLLRYEKDDQLRTVWLDGRRPTVHDFGIQGFSVGRYESERAHRRDGPFRLRHHGLRRLQRHSFVPAEARHRALLARRQRTAGHDHRRGSDVSAEAGVVHDPVGCRRPRDTKLVGVRLRSGIGEGHGEVPRRPGTSSINNGESVMNVQRWLAAAAAVLAIGLLKSAVPVVAHHASTAFYDATKKVEAQGTRHEIPLQEPARVSLLQRHR